ncbi:MAG TPA: class I tRNA ligase family protein, partial [Clostridiales bacterium]|nr:class I tRNA ligase family protein [Clostridiales bacterium]
DLLTDGDEYTKELTSAFHKTVKKVSEDIEAMKFNTAVAALMTLLNQIYDKGAVNRAELQTFLTLLNPFAPHITEEAWEMQHFGGMMAEAAWPTYEEAKCVEEEVEIAVQVNGKIKARIQIPADLSAEEAIQTAKGNDRVATLLDGKTVLKELYVKGHLVNLVVK